MELGPDVIVSGNLRLLRPLGQGGMGVVWVARHLSLDTEVAVKFVRPERVAADPVLVDRFEREAKAAARIAHPHIVRVMDYGTADRAIPFIVMELLRGATLADLLDRGGRLSFATAASLVQQVGSALESAREHGIVHRDIKPQNIFITQGSKEYALFVKVLDFGLAKIVGGALGSSSTLTETGMVIGSPPYMSPEQLEARKDVDLRSDLWSLGVIVYEALTGTRPFHGSSFVSVGAAVLAGKYRRATMLRPDLPASIDDWFAKVLCVDTCWSRRLAPLALARSISSSWARRALSPPNGLLPRLRYVRPPSRSAFALRSVPRARLLRGIVRLAPPPRRRSAPPPLRGGAPRSVVARARAPRLLERTALPRRAPARPRFA